MKKTTVILFVIVAASLLTGCQPTPAVPAVLGKDLEQMLALAKSGEDSGGSIRERLGVPQRYESYIENSKGNFKVTIDADVILPQADSIPIVRVEARPFDQQTLDKMIGVLFEDGKLYDPAAMSEMTKQELSDILMKLGARKAELEGQGMKPSLPDPSESEAAAEDGPQASGGAVMASAGNQLDMVNEAIYTLGELAKTAPEQKKLVEVSGKLKALDLAAGMTGDERKEYEGKLVESAHAGQLCPQGGMRSIMASNDEVINMYQVEYINRGDFDANSGMYFSEDEWEGMEDMFTSAKEQEEFKTLPGPSITPEEAKQTAEQFLAQMGIDYLTCERSDRVIGGSSSYYSDGVRAGSLLKAYRLQYVRKLNGVPLTYTNIETTAGTDSNMIWNWAYERMTFIIDDRGIAEMKWEAPYNIKETLTDDAAMLPFSKVRDIFEKMIIVGNSYYAETGADMNITEVRLGLMRIFEQNNTARGLLIPVWDFFGTLTTHSEASGDYTINTPGQVWLTVNAIDGTVIDRSLGY